MRGSRLRALENHDTRKLTQYWLRQIIAGTKKIEYHQIKPYWTKRFAKVSVPFELRLRRSQGVEMIAPCASQKAPQPLGEFASMFLYRKDVVDSHRKPMKANREAGSPST